MDTGGGFRRGVITDECRGRNDRGNNGVSNEVTARVSDGETTGDGFTGGLTRQKTGNTRGRYGITRETTGWTTGEITGGKGYLTG